MAQRNLREAAEAVKRQPDVAGRLDVDDDEVDTWLRAAALMAVPYDTQRGVHMQSDAFTHHEEWDFANTPPENYPLLLHYPYFEIYRKQVVKQADLVMALHLRGDAFTLEEKIADFAYYEARTTRDSSLSASQQAVVAAETGHLQLAYDYWAEAALTDLQNLHHNSGHGLHIASLAGGLDGRGGRLRRDARPQRGADVRAAPARADHPAAVPRRLPGPEADGDGHPREAPPTGWRTASRSTSATTAARSPSTTRTWCSTSRRRRRWSRSPSRSGCEPRRRVPGHCGSSGQQPAGAEDAARRRRPAGRRRPRTAPGNGVSRASWSASESGARRRRRAVCSSSTVAGGGQQQEPGGQRGEGGLTLGRQPPGGGEDDARR